MHRWNLRHSWLLLALLVAIILPAKAHGNNETEHDNDHPSSHRKSMFHLRRRTLITPGDRKEPRPYAQSLRDDLIETATEFGDDLIETATEFGEEMMDQATRFQEDASAFVEDASAFMQELLPPEPPIFQEMQQFWSTMNRNVRGMEQQFKNSLLKNVFHQRLGWERLRHSVRNHLGFFVGFWVTFQGQSHPWLAYQKNQGEEGGGGSLALHFAQVFWHFLDVTSFLPHTPWSQDLACVLVVQFVSKWGLPRANSHMVQFMPRVLLGLTMLPLWSLVLEEWSAQDQFKSEVTFPVVWLATVLTFGALKLQQIPVPLAASSLSGSLLIYDSMRAEIAGNYIYMLETCIVYLVRPTISLLRGLIKFIWRPALRLWRGWLQETIHNLLYRDDSEETDLPWLIISTVQKFGSMVKMVWTTLTNPINKVKQVLAAMPVIQAANELSKRLQRAFKPVIVPLSIATWGVAVQMKYITNIGQVWKILRLSINPISFARGQVKAFFSAESRTLKAVLRAVRSLPRKLAPRREVPTA
jgi:hypothetical protein